jgi:hypothetical protein
MQFMNAFWKTSIQYPFNRPYTASNHYCSHNLTPCARDGQLEARSMIMCPKPSSLAQASSLALAQAAHGLPLEAA